jgi:hypothetical protein
MGADAYGVGYPRIDLDYSDNGSHWVTSSYYSFGSVDDLLVDPPHFLPVEDVPPVDLADGTSRAFLKGWRIYAEIGWRAIESNALIAFLDLLYDWLAGGTYRRIYYVPHVDVESYEYLVRVKSRFEPKYLRERFGDIEGGLILEGVELLAGFPYYEP